MSQPPWLQRALQEPKLSAVLQALDSREIVRESARTARNDSPIARSPFSGLLRTSRIPSTVKSHYSCSVGQGPIYKRHNRYLAIEPYDRTRVLVPTPSPVCDQSVSEMGTIQPRYLNANWVRESAGGKWWIACQAPLPISSHAFLTLCMSPVAPPSTTCAVPSPLPPERRVHTVVQLTHMVERGRRKAHPYFPISPQQSVIIHAEPGCNAPPIHVYNDGEEVIRDAECIKTNLRLRWGNAEVDGDSLRRDQDEWRVTHLFYTAWPDFGVPGDNRSILSFARLVEHFNNRHLSPLTDNPNASPPVLIHCSAGVGRTGSFIALSSLLRVYSLLSPSCSPSLKPPASLPMSPLGPLPQELDDDPVAHEIDALREQRPSMVQREEQIVWAYKALSDAFENI